VVCIVEGDHREDGVHFMVRHLELLPPKLPYPRVADRLGAIFRGLRKQARSFPVYINESSVGPPIVGLISRACKDTSYQRVYYNHGQQAPDYTGLFLNLGKAWRLFRNSSGRRPPGRGRAHRGGRGWRFGSGGGCGSLARSV